MNQAALCVSCHGVLEADDANGLCAACLQRSLLFGDLDEVESLGGDLGDYEILSEIARGGMGVVFKARSRRLKRIVALKLVHVTTASRASMRQRFLFEAEIAAGLDHPNIVPVYEFGESDGRPWFSMKLVEGGSLEARLAEYVVPPDARDPARCRRVAELMSTVARAVQYAHDHGVLHRDLKPSNILVDESGVPHVTDFGLAKRLDGGGTMTLPEVVLGTPAYMAPEVARSGASAAGVRSDLYSLGAVLHHLLSGRPPFAAKSTLELIREVAESRQPTASKLGRHVDRDLAIICSKCLENPEQRRYATASDLADDLDRYLRGEPIHARAITWVEQGWHWCRMRPVMTMLVGFLMLALGIGAAGILSQWQRAEDNLRKSEVSELLAVAAERKSGENAYFAQIAEAMSAREKGDLGRAARLLAMQGSGQGRFEWRLLSWLNQGDSTRQRVVPGGGVRCMTWVPQRQRVAMVGEDRVLRWLDPLTDVLEEGITIPALEDRHADVVLDRGFHAIGFAPDGRHLFCADGDLLMVLEAATGKVLHTAAGRHMAGLWLDDRRLLLGGCILWGADRGDATEIFDVVSGETRVIPKRRHAPFAMSADGQWLAWVRIGQAGSEIQILKSADLESPNPTILRSISTRVMDAGLLAFSGDGRHLIQCLGDTTGLMGHLEVVSLETGEVMLRQAFPAQIRGIATDPSEPVVAVATDDAVLRTLRYGEKPPVVLTYDDGARPGLSQPVGSEGPQEPPERLLSRTAGEGRFQFFLGHRERIHDVLALRAGGRWLTASEDGTLSWWPREAAILGARVSGVRTSNPWEHPTASRDGRFVLYRGETDQCWLWDRKTGARHAFPEGTHAVAVMNDGRAVTRHAGTDEIDVWGLPATEGKVPTRLWRIRGTEAYPRFGQMVRGVLSADGRNIVGLLPGRLFVVDLENRLAVGTGDERMLHGSNGVNCMDVSPDSKWIAVTGFIGRRVRVYRVDDVNAGHVALGNPADYDTAVAFHPDGRRLFVGNEDGWVRVFDVGTRQELPAEGWRAQTGAVTALAVSGDGNVVATSGDRTLRFWEALPGSEPGLMRRERMQVNVPTARNWMRFGDGDRVLLHSAPGQPLEAWEAP